MIIVTMENMEELKRETGMTEGELGGANFILEDLDIAFRINDDEKLPNWIVNKIGSQITREVIYDECKFILLYSK